MPHEITETDLDRWFTYHAPEAHQIECYAHLRNVARELAIAIVKLCPSGPDQSAAIRKVREAVMTANAAIACDDPKG